MTDRHRIALVGAGWIMPMHLAALDRLGRTDLVGVASRRLASAEATAVPRGAPAFDDVERMLDEVRPEVVYIAVPPSAAVAACEAVVRRSIPASDATTFRASTARRKGLTLVHCRRSAPRHLAAAVDLVARGAVDLDRVVSDVVRLGAAAAGFSALAARRGHKIVVAPGLGA